MTGKEREERPSARLHRNQTQVLLLIHSVLDSIVKCLVFPTVGGASLQSCTEQSLVWNDWSDGGCSQQRPLRVTTSPQQYPAANTAQRL